MKTIALNVYCNVYIWVLIVRIERSFLISTVQKARKCKEVLSATALLPAVQQLLVVTVAVALVELEYVGDGHEARALLSAAQSESLALRLPVFSNVCSFAASRLGSLLHLQVHTA